LVTGRERKMKILMIVRIPHETFNAAVRDGSAGEKLNKILEASKPESVYFTEIDGERTVVMVVEMKESSEIPSFAEPWFLTFEADVEFHPAMTPDDLKIAGLDTLGKKWRE
jgi:hypothetical protein